MSITIITDGSADNNNGSGGWAAIVRRPNTLDELQGWAEGTTSNRMELTAALEGLRSVTIPSDITLITDSTYLLKTMKNKWYERWLQEEPHRTKVRPNMDLWHQLIGLNSFHNIHFIKIKGHSGDYWNERADRLADQARRSKLSSQVSIQDWAEGTRCRNISPSDRQCKLHDGHSGRCYYTNGTANGVEVYGSVA